MTISKSPVAKTSVALGDVKKEDEILVLDEPLESVGPVHGPTVHAPTVHAPTVHAATVAPSGRSGGSGLVGIFTTLVLVGATAAGWFYRETWWPKVAPLIGFDTKAPVKPPRPPVPIVTAVVQQKNMDVFINGLGTVTAFKTVTIRSRVEGELVKVAFTEGQIVCEGDQIAEIDRRPFDVQLQQAEGQLARDEATLTSAELTLKRYLELMEKKSIAQQQVDEQRALVQQTTGAIQTDRASVAGAKLQLQYCHIIAPVSGRIGLRLVDQGNIVRANDPMGMAVITQLQPISLIFTIPQDDISRVQKASKDGNELTVLAYDRNLKVKLATGKLLAIDNQVDSTTGTVRIKAIFDNEDGMLFPNQFVNARLLVDRKAQAIVVPTAAVQRGPTNYFVYVVRDEGEEKVVELRPVTPGLSEGAETSVDTGLSPGEIVVTDGLDKLQDKVKVLVRDLEKEQREKKSGDKSRAAEKKPGSEEKSSGGKNASDDAKRPLAESKKNDKKPAEHGNSATQTDMKTSP